MHSSRFILRRYLVLGNRLDAKEKVYYWRYDNKYGPKYGRLDGRMEWRSTSHELNLQNQLANEEAAFTLLHLLSHLNGASFKQTQGLANLNPSILQALTDHHRAMGGDYRLHYNPEKDIPGI